MKQARASSLYLRILVAAAEKVGVDIAPCLVELGIDASLKDDVDAWFPRESIYALWEMLVEKTGDRELGVRVAELFARDPNVGVVEYAARNATKLADAYGRVERYGRLVLDGSEFRFEWQEDSGVISYAIADDPTGPVRPAADWALVSLVLKGRAFVGVDFTPVEVALPYPEPDDAPELQRLVRCPITYSAPKLRLVVARTDLERPVVGADRGLSVTLDRYADELITRLPSHASTTDRVRQLLARVLSSGGDPSLQALAGELHMSARTLQRRLSDEGAQHRDLVDDIRRDLALRYVSAGALSIGEMTFLLGFSEPSAFLRAFRRWTGSTPGRVRAEPTRTTSML